MTRSYRRASLGVVVALAFPLFGCSSSPGFDGTWDCTVTSTTTYTEPVGAADYDGDGTYVLSITQSGSSLTESRTTGGAGPTCPLTFELDGDGTAATLGAGQTCLNSVDNTVAFQSGTTTLTMNASEVSGTYAFTVTGEGSGGLALAGSGTGTYTCTRD